MSFFECDKCGGVPGVTACCSDRAAMSELNIEQERREFEEWRSEMRMLNETLKSDTSDLWKAWLASKRTIPETAEISKDAERYRWLRIQCQIRTLTICHFVQRNLKQWSYDNPDKHIDAAMNAMKREKS